MRQDPGKYFREEELISGVAISGYQSLVFASGNAAEKKKVNGASYLGKDR